MKNVRNDASPPPYHASVPTDDRLQQVAASTSILQVAATPQTLVPRRPAAITSTGSNMQMMVNIGGGISAGIYNNVTVRCDILAPILLLVTRYTTYPSLLRSLPNREIGDERTNKRYWW
jgi:hypothetical protein